MTGNRWQPRQENTDGSQSWPARRTITITMAFMLHDVLETTRDTSLSRRQMNTSGTEESLRSITTSFDTRWVATGAWDLTAEAARPFVSAQLRAEPFWYSAPGNVDRLGHQSIPSGSALSAYAGCAAARDDDCWSGFSSEQHTQRGSWTRLSSTRRNNGSRYTLDSCCIKLDGKIASSLSMMYPTGRNSQLITCHQQQHWHCHLRHYLHQSLMIRDDDECIMFAKNQTAATFLVNRQELIRRWDSERELLVRRYLTCTSKYSPLLNIQHDARCRQTRQWRREWAWLRDITVTTAPRFSYAPIYCNEVRFEVILPEYHLTTG